MANNKNIKSIGRQMLADGIAVLSAFPIWEIIYWIIASLFMFFVFSNRHYDIQIRTNVSILLLLISFASARIINKVLIPKFLFKGKTGLFIYSIFFLIIISSWLISIALFLITFYSNIAFENTILPSREDVIILLTGTYIIALVSSMFYFTRESYQSKEEKLIIEKEKNQLELKFKEVQLQLLKEQIHPHFIFNMMNNLYALVNVSTALSREVIVRLSDLLEYMLYKCNTEKVALSKEIEFINNYIELEKIRHDDSFNVRTDFPEDLTGIKIAPLVLFPFVENAFKHGLKQTNNDFITMQLMVTATKIQFNINNYIHNIKVSEAKTKKSNGLGLKNVRERLELLYLNRYDLQISTNNNIFDVKLKIIR
ncbi:sensor histidine kinase [Plebeiibacterium marinum]|uniref:Histidine kinase n=1 Tax=Plebeiibacterium marinum TaxID=2992111 RepID=A0AAE3MBZ6_9BACT|nr:histidine kinase [Plebeiobacterium marinum]MCW3804936.1 histidine kinase [Plebeiobacterium marinum]